jgi:two-component system, OmpR family, sensor histidine kinase SenX3
MEPTTVTVLAALLGALLGGGTVLAWRISDRQLRAPEPATTPAEAVVVPAGLSTVLHVLRSSGLVIDEHDRVLQASAPAYAFGLVRGSELRVPELLDTVREVRRKGEIRQLDLQVRRGPGNPPILVQARVAPLNSRLVLVLAEDQTRERRVDAIRRDFVANVSHELKTPVGALMLLADATDDAADDPEAVRRFAGRMRTEANRLTRLVLQIIELSRLQGDELLEKPTPVPVDRMVTRAMETNQEDAKAKSIDVVWDGRHELRLLGNEDQIVLALSNLVANAIAYSGERSRVTITAQPVGDLVELSVSDEGVGIPGAELERIFERFYRIDPSRHRATGGTGLGLSIVKHVAATHGGEVTVWSREGQGSTFTLRLPRHLKEEPGAAVPDPEPVVGSRAEPVPTHRTRKEQP